MEQPFTDADTIAGRVPGPGHYPERTSSLKGYSKAQRARSSNLGMLQRFHGVHTPQHITSLRDTSGAPTTAFSSTLSRDCLVPQKTKEEADPCTYDRHLSVGQSVEAKLREQARIGKHGAFGSTKKGSRFAGFALVGRKEGPAPHDYGHATTGDMQVSGLNADNGGVAFRSKSARISSVGLGGNDEESPGPGEYEMPSMGSSCMEFSPPRKKSVTAKPWQTPEQKQASTGAIFFYDGFSSDSGSASSPVSAAVKKTMADFRKPRTEHLSFGSGASRSIQVTRNSITPGPGNYEPAAAMAATRSSGGAIKSTESRKLEPPSKASLRREHHRMNPGPGAYNLARNLGERTFNISGERAASVLLQHAAKISEAAVQPSSTLALQSSGGAGGQIGGTRKRPNHHEVEPAKSPQLRPSSRGGLLQIRESPKQRPSPRSQRVLQPAGEPGDVDPFPAGPAADAASPVAATPEVGPQWQQLQPPQAATAPQGGEEPEPEQPAPAAAEE